MISSRIIRIRHGPLRAALWTAWFPVVALAYLITAPRPSLTMLGSVYLIGIDGIE